MVLVGFFLAAAGRTARSQETDSHEGSEASVCRLGSQRTWLFRSFLKDDDADALGLEFESYLSVGALEIKNFAYFEVNQYPRAIPGQPVGNPTPGVEPANGINDLLTGFWFSKKGPRH